MDVNTWLAAAVVLATLVGPILAVVVTRYVDRRREIDRRRLDVFRTLMRLRRNFLAQEYVGALNMVEIEFAGVEPVARAYQTLFNHYQSPSEAPNWHDQLQRLTARLLYAMGKSMGYSMEQLDILEGGYLPQAYGETEAAQAEIRKGLLAVLRGARPFPVSIHTSPPVPMPTDNPVPPPVPGPVPPPSV